MTATERKALALHIDVIFRPAERDDLPKLEWYGQYTHFRRVFQRAYEDQVAGRRLMLLARSEKEMSDAALAFGGLLAEAMEGLRD